MIALSVAEPICCRERMVLGQNSVTISREKKLVSCVFNVPKRRRIRYCTSVYALLMLY